MAERSERIILTGASGYIGKFLHRALSLTGHSIVVVGRPGATLEGLAASSFIPYEGSAIELTRSIAHVQPTIIYHLATHFRPEHQTADIEPMVSANLTFGTALLEAVAQHRPTFINVGTVWQNYQGTTGRANCLYAATKNAFQEILAFYADAYQLNAATLQLSDVYGPDDHRKKLFWHLKEAASTGKAVTLSPGEQLLDLLHVNDAIAALQAVATHLQARRADREVQHFAASSGSLHSLKNVVDLFEKALGKPVPASWGSRPYRTREIMRPTIPWPPPPGWSAKVTLATGLRDLVSKELL